MSLSDYFKLKEIERLELEKKSLVILKNIFSICVKKGFHFTINPNTHSVSVCCSDRFEESLQSYYKGDLLGYKSIYCYPINEVLEILKTKK